MATIFCVAVLGLLCVNVMLVSGALRFQFQPIGPYDYNGGKAYMEGDDVKLICAIDNAQELVQNGYNVVYVLVNAQGEMKLTNNQELSVPNPNGRYLIQHNVDSPDDQEYNLFINDLTEADEGEYQCRVENSAGFVITKAEWTQAAAAGGGEPHITVLYLPDENRYPECVVDEGTVDVKLGSSLTLKCTSEFGNPRVDLEWKRNNGVDPDPRNQISVASTTTTAVEINNVAEVTISAEYDGVVFYCYMTPSLEFFPGKLKSCQIGPINIIDNHLTLPTVTPLVQVAEPGDTVSFQCDLAGETQAQFTWSWDPSWDFEKTFVTPDNRTFTIRNIRSYHHLTKIYCNTFSTFSEGVQVSAYGLIRVNADQYEVPPADALSPDDNDDIEMPPDGNGGGSNPGDDTSTGAPRFNDGDTTTKSAAAGRIRFQPACLRFGLVLVFSILSLYLS